MSNYIVLLFIVTQDVWLCIVCIYGIVEVLLIVQVNDIIEHPPDPSSVAADNLAGLAGLPPGLMSTYIRVALLLNLIFALY